MIKTTEEIKDYMPECEEDWNTKWIPLSEHEEILKEIWWQVKCPWTTDLVQDCNCKACKQLKNGDFWKLKQKLEEQKNNEVENETKTI